MLSAAGASMLCYASANALSEKHDLCLLLQEAIRGNRFNDSLDSTGDLVARYIFTADYIQEGRIDANGLKKVPPSQ